MLKSLTNIRKPKILSFKDMFMFWTDNLKREKPHLIITNIRASGPVNGKDKLTEVWYNIKEELNYLENRNLTLDASIQELEITDRDIRRFTPATQEIFEMKKELMTNKMRIKELSKLPKEHKEKIIDYEQFKEIINLFNKKASDAIIQGSNLNLSNRLGYVQIRKIKNSVRVTNKIDWKESLEYKKELIATGKIPKDKLHPEGSNWLVYKNQTYYLRWAWVKRYNRACTVKNNRVYAFYPTSSSSGAGNREKVPGNKTKLALAQEADPLLHNKYTVVNLGPRFTHTAEIIAP